MFALTLTVFSEDCTSFHSDSLFPGPRRPSTGARDNCNGGGGPTLATGALDDGNGDSNGGGDPTLAMDVRGNNNRNRDDNVQGEGNCGGGGSGNDGDDDGSGGGGGDND